MRIVMTGGGTGGHLYPALAIAEQIKRAEPNSVIVFLGSKDSIESEIVPKNGYEFRAVPARWFYRGNGFFSDALEFIKAGCCTFAGIIKSINLIRKFRPDAVIGTGGFVSVPVIVAGRICGAKCYIHEQNAYPGIANKLMAGLCEKVFLGFSGAGKRFRNAEKTVYTGNPVREVFFSLDKEASREKLKIPKSDFVLFSFGGSLGSKVLNDIAENYIKHIGRDDNKTILFGTGSRFYDEVRKDFSSYTSGEIKVECDSSFSFNDNRVRIMSYIDNMADAISSADLIICRAGALSLAEITACGRAAIIVPYPKAADNHQYYNAKVIADGGGGVLCEQENLETEKINSLIDDLAADKMKISEMETASGKLGVKDAGRRIVEEIMGSLNDKVGKGKTSGK
ncbi:MAG: undecaprenyldiphospho-muramoylpentapeptide beta-N-acetylglucosaminyltransferase [Eubacterium sp.]|nr:undecaprenyldiphospho-muramoylpentapeptide beta-N-acetylglucosaminyltransferase [Eubacterium sp.]